MPSRKDSPARWWVAPALWRPGNRAAQRAAHDWIRPRGVVRIEACGAACDARDSPLSGHVDTLLLCRPSGRRDRHCCFGRPQTANRSLGWPEPSRAECPAFVKPEVFDRPPGPARKAGGSPVLADSRGAASRGLGLRSRRRGCGGSAPAWSRCSYSPGDRENRANASPATPTSGLAASMGRCTPGDSGVRWWILQRTDVERSCKGERPVLVIPLVETRTLSLPTALP